VLYRLAEGDFDERVEAAILAEARERRVDEDAMWAICEKLAPPDDDADDDQDDGGDDGSGDSEPAAAEDPESAAILDGDPPKPPPAADPPPPDFALRDFDRAVGELKRLMTKPSAKFAASVHSAHDLESVEDFLRAVTKAKATPIKVTV